MHARHFPNGFNHDQKHRHLSQREELFPPLRAHSRIDLFRLLRQRPRQRSLAHGRPGSGMLGQNLLLEMMGPCVSKGLQRDAPSRHVVADEGKGPHEENPNSHPGQRERRGPGKSCEGVQAVEDRVGLFETCF